MEETIVHGSAIVIEGRDLPPSAVLLLGNSGRGKSDISFQLIERGAKLISDDRVVLKKEGGDLIASAPEAIYGLLEVRGLGLLRYPVAEPTKISLIIDFVEREDVPRLPDDKIKEILGVNLPCLSLHAFDSSTALKINKAIELVHRPELLVR